MSFIQRQAVAIATDTNGAATVYSVSANGLLHSFYLDVGTLTNTVDLTITEEDTGKALLTLTDVGASATYMPRAAAHSVAGAALLFSAGNPVTDLITVNGRIKIVVAGGGSTHVGTLYLYLV